jgi:hypothetical protein
MIDTSLYLVYTNNILWRCYMGSRDFAQREKKKQKKDGKKENIISASIEIPKPEVEVIKKGKKNKEFEE